MTQNTAARQSFQPNKADVIIVLGAAVWAGGIPSPALLRRVLHALDLFKRGLSDILLVSGGIGKNPPSEAEIMRRIAIEHGVAADQIIMEDTAKTTFDSAVACSRIIYSHGWSKALLVTDRYHMTRSAVLFRLCGVNVHCSPAEHRGFGPRRWKWWYWHLREFMALPWSILRFYAHKIKR